MSCTCGHEDCDCKKEVVDSNLTAAEREMIERIEFAVGYAININLTNFYKRELMKNTLEGYVALLSTRLYTKELSNEEKKTVKEEWKQELYKALDKIAQAEDGYSAIKEFASVIADSME